MNLGTLRSQLKAMLNRSDLTNDDTQADIFINRGIRHLERNLRLPFMEKTLAYTSSGEVAYPMPWDYLQLIGVFWKGRRLERVTDSDAGKYADTHDSGEPKIYWREGQVFKLYPTPAAGDRVEIRYYGEFENLQGDAYETFELEVIPDLILYAALIFACDFYVDERKPLWKATFDELTQSAQAAAEADEFAGRDLRMGSPFQGIDY